MDKFKKTAKALLFPHTAVLILLLPIATVFLVYSLINLDSSSILSIASYVIAMYTLTIWCARTPKLITKIKNFKNENKYAKRWLGDVHLRTNISLHGSLLLNIAYSALQLGLGFYHHSFWYYSLAAYYISLAIMRFFLVRHTSRHKPGEKMREELLKYRACGWVFLAMNMALTGMIFFMIYLNRTFVHHEITTIALAAYTFTAFSLAIINTVKYRKYNSPVISASKAISLAAACVSMITLTSTMLTTFGSGIDELMFRRLMLTLIGTAVSIFIITMAIYMIIRSNKALRELEIS